MKVSLQPRKLGIGARPSLQPTLEVHATFSRLWPAEVWPWDAHREHIMELIGDGAKRSIACPAGMKI